MKLSEFEDDYFVVEKNGEFFTLGNVHSNPQKKYLTFCTDENFLKIACKDKFVSCVICTPQLKDLEVLITSGKGIAVAENPRYAFNRLHNDLCNNNESYITAYKENIIGKNCIIHPTAIIDNHNVKIGNNVRIEENVIIRAGVSIDDNCIIKAGAIIGYGACLAGRDDLGNLYPLCSAGTVKIEKNVQIGSYSSISLGLFPYEETRVGENSLIGYSVVISHSCIIRKNSIILDQSQICGEVIMDENVRVSPHAVVSNSLRLGKECYIAIGAVVVNNIKQGMKVAGNFAIEHSKFLLWHRKKIKNKK